ncbi:MAG: threonine synthase, partial [Sarcina sp.]
FKNIPGLKVIVFYPKNGVSKIQEYQMLTQEGNNVSVVSINGNFDDAQSAVKKIFADNDFKKVMKEKNILFSSANSINIARLIPQIVYYFYGYFKLLNDKKIQKDEQINIVVPTGNFGNILAAYYAKKIGLPINNFICASNENNVLTNFINTKVYDKNRELILTESPSMDILVSSNLERLLFELTNRDSEKVANFMDLLNTTGIYEIDDNMKNNMKDFYAYSTDKNLVYYEIKNLFENKNYLMDTHTAVAYSAYKQYVDDTKDDKKVLIASTASPYKFVKSIVNAIGLEKNENKSEFELLDLLNKKSGVEIPKNLNGLDKKQFLHNINCGKDEVKIQIIDILES